MVAVLNHRQLPILEIEGLTVGVQRADGLAPILDNVSLTLKRGEALGVAGESGSGKSTAALAVCRLLSPALDIKSGQVRLAGEPINDLAEPQLDQVRWKRVAYVFQGAMNAFNPVTTIGEQIAEAIRCHLECSRVDAVERAGQLLDSVGIDRERSDAYPHQFSGGMRQRAMMAMALAADPEVLIADEPTTALDVVVQAQVLDLLTELRRQRGLSLLMISHDLAAIAETCDRVAIMNAGRVVEVGPVVDVLSRPQHTYTQTLVAAAPRADQDYRSIKPTDGEPGAGPDDRRPGSPGRLRPPNTERGGRADTSLLFEMRDIAVHYQLPPRWRDWFTRRPAPVIKAVDGVDLAVRAGEIHAIVGESGSGKSTLARVATRLVRPSTGSLFLDGEDVTQLRAQRDMRAYRRRIQMVFQDPFSSLNPHQRLFDQIAEPLIVNGLGGDKAQLRERVLQTLAATGLNPVETYAHRFPHELSGGQKQRAVIAGALILQPEILVADEPVSMLDVSVRAEIIKLLLDLRSQLGLAYFFITHDLPLAAAIADRVSVMRQGRIIETGTPDEVLKRPKQQYTRSLLDAAPTLDLALKKKARTKTKDHIDA